MLPVIVVEYIDQASGALTVSGLWTIAEEMGRLAGRNIVGANNRYRGFLSVMNATSIYGVPLSLGLIESEEKDVDTFVDDSIGSYRKFVFRGNLLLGQCSSVI